MEDRIGIIYHLNEMKNLFKLYNVWLYSRLLYKLVSGFASFVRISFYLRYLIAAILLCIFIIQ